ncbi:MAG: class I SAM-dependent methyltransferase, partial [Chthoniobacteraceae bacterium]
AVADWARGKRVLDCFSNQGAFALACAKSGATEVTAVEISADCCQLLRGNAERNGLAINVVEHNVFDYLKAEEVREAKYDLIILDPPSFTKSKGKLQDAMRGYKEIHLRALKLLAPEGLLATFSCSHHVSGEGFREMIVESLVDAKRSARVLQTFSQAADHPILAGIPETEYLKGCLLELAPGR